MKTKIYSLALFTLFLLSSCNSDDFLNVKPRGKDIPSTYAHYNGLLSSALCYYGTEGNLYFPLLSDEFYTTSTGLVNIASKMQGPQGGKCFRYEDNIYNSDDAASDWSYNSSLYTYNLIINDVLNATDGTEKQRLSVQSEARVMRAWLFFCSAQIFCKPYNESTAASDAGVPIVTTADSNLSNFERGTLKSLFTFIISEMEEACPNILNSTNHIYRTEKGDAYQMLGMVYFYMQKYDKALAALRLAKQYQTANGTLQLNNMNDQTDETITEQKIPFYQDVENTRLLYTSITAGSYYQSDYEYNPTLYVKDKYYNLFSDSDRRRCRFISDETGHCATTIEEMMGTTTPDLYTILAECEARVGDESEARSLLFTLRESRMPETEAAIPDEVNTKNKLVRFCIEERIREILGSGRFLFEMRRLWNDSDFAYLKTDYKHVVVDTNESYPLSENRLTLKIAPKVMAWNSSWANND